MQQTIPDDRLRQAREQGRPVWVGGRLSMTRPELQERWSVYPPAHPKPHFLNETAAFILKRCDGEHDLDRIASALIEEYDGVNPELASRDTVSCLSFLLTLGLIEWTGPGSPSRDAASHNGVHMAEERDFPRIRKFMNAFLGERAALIERDPAPDFFLMTLVCSENAHQEILLRTRHFNNVEIFFCLEEDGKLAGVASLQPSTRTGTSASIGILCALGPRWGNPRVEALLRSLTEFCGANGIRRLRLGLIPYFQHDPVRNLLRTHGFEFELMLKDELANGVDMECWSAALQERATTVAGSPAAS